MKTPTVIFTALFLSAVAGLQAATVVQTVEFDYSDSYVLPAGESVSHVDATFFSGSFLPFSASLGTLESITISWVVENTVSGNTNASGNTPQLSFGSSLYVNASSYSGMGGGGSTGGPPGTPFSMPANTSNTTTLQVADFGGSYDPAILAAITGVDSYDVSYPSAITLANLSAHDMAFDVVTSGTVTVTYNYAAVPEPASCAALVGLVALGFVASRRRGQRDC